MFLPIKQSFSEFISAVCFVLFLIDTISKSLPIRIEGKTYFTYITIQPTVTFFLLCSPEHAFLHSYNFFFILLFFT